MFALLGCAGSGSTPASPKSEHRVELVPVRDLAGMPVYDAKGGRKSCEPPRSSCPEQPIYRDFTDQCALRGYQLRQCGCEQLCTGNVMIARKHYDSRGNTKACAPETRDCSPPETGAAFQDACNDKGHKLVVCGCEWLCTGEPAK